MAQKCKKCEKTFDEDIIIHTEKSEVCKECLVLEFWPNPEEVNLENLRTFEPKIFEGKPFPGTEDVYKDCGICEAILKNMGNVLVIGVRKRAICCKSCFLVHDKKVHEFNEKHRELRNLAQDRDSDYFRKDICCSDCTVKIWDKLAEFSINDSIYCVDCFVFILMRDYKNPPPANELSKCTKCEKTFQGIRPMQTMCMDCFVKEGLADRCTKCEEPLKGKFDIMGAEQICKRCFIGYLFPTMPIEHLDIASILVDDYRNLVNSKDTVDIDFPIVNEELGYRILQEGVVERMSPKPEKGIALKWERIEAKELKSLPVESVLDNAQEVFTELDGIGLVRNDKDLLERVGKLDMSAKHPGDPLRDLQKFLDREDVALGVMHHTNAIEIPRGAEIGVEIIARYNDKATDPPIVGGVRMEGVNNKVPYTEKDSTGEYPISWVRTGKNQYRAHGVIIPDDNGSDMEQFNRADIEERYLHERMITSVVDIMKRMFFDCQLNMVDMQQCLRLAHICYQNEMEREKNDEDDGKKT